MANKYPETTYRDNGENFYCPFCGECVEHGLPVPEDLPRFVYECPNCWKHFTVQERYNGVSLSSPPQQPRRAVELNLTISTDDLTTARDLLAGLLLEFKKLDSDSFPYRDYAGGLDGGYTLRVDVDPKIDNLAYHLALEKWLWTLQPDPHDNLKRALDESEAGKDFYRGTLPPDAKKPGETVTLVASLVKNSALNNRPKERPLFSGPPPDAVTLDGTQGPITLIHPKTPAQREYEEKAKRAKDKTGDA